MVAEFVYVLRLQKNRYYVGRTTDVNRRFQEHKKGGAKSAVWTREYKPIGTGPMAVFKSERKYDEHMYTLLFMSRFGINNVRGSVYSQLVLPTTTMSLIRDLLSSVDDLCYVCGSAEHMATDCTMDKTFPVDDDVEEDEENQDDDDEEEDDDDDALSSSTSYSSSSSVSEEEGGSDSDDEDDGNGDDYLPDSFHKKSKIQTE